MKRPEHDLESIVFLRVNPDRKGIVTGHLTRPGGAFLYLVAWDEPVEEKEHWPCELCTERPLDLPNDS